MPVGGAPPLPELLLELELELEPDPDPDPDPELALEEDPLEATLLDAELLLDPLLTALDPPAPPPPTLLLELP